MGLTVTRRLADSQNESHGEEDKAGKEYDDEDNSDIHLKGNLHSVIIATDERQGFVLVTSTWSPAALFIAISCAIVQ